MYGFGYNGFNQIQNSDSQIIKTPVHILPCQCRLEPTEADTTVKSSVEHSNFTKSSDIERLTCEEHVITHTSVSWDKILFISQNGGCWIRGQSADISLPETVTEASVRWKSGCLTWNGTVLLSTDGQCYYKLPESTSKSTDSTANIKWAKVEMTKDDASFHFDDAVSFKEVSGGGKHCFAATDSQRVGNICQESSGCLLRPINLHVAIKELSCGKEHTVLVSRIGAVFTCGIGGQGQLGHGDIESHNVPRQVEALEAVSVVHVAAGGWHSVVLSDIGDLYVWGWNERGQLGFPSKIVRESSQKKDVSCVKNPDNKMQLQPSATSDTDFINILTEPAVLDICPNLGVTGSEVTGSGVTVIKVSCGSRHTAAVTECGKLYTWGWNKYGQLGHGDVTSRDTPTLVQYFHDNHLSVTEVTCGYWTSIVQTAKIS